MAFLLDSFLVNTESGFVDTQQASCPVCILFTFVFSSSVVEQLPTSWPPHRQSHIASTPTAAKSRAPHYGSSSTSSPGQPQCPNTTPLHQFACTHSQSEVHFNLANIVLPSCSNTVPLHQIVCSEVHFDLAAQCCLNLADTVSPCRPNTTPLHLQSKVHFNQVVTMLFCCPNSLLHLPHRQFAHIQSWIESHLPTQASLVGPLSTTTKLLPPPNLTQTHIGLPSDAWAFRSWPLKTPSRKRDQ
jgi:hypothetical protein